MKREIKAMSDKANAIPAMNENEKRWAKERAAKEAAAKISKE